MRRDGGSIRTVTFAHPFRMTGLAGEHPAGSYVVETGGAPGDGTPKAAPPGETTWIRLPLPWGAAGSPRRVPIDPAALEAALQCDRANAAGGTQAAAERA